MSDEQTTNEEDKAQEEPKDTSIGDTPKANNIVEQARTERKGIEEALKETKEVLKQLRELEAQRELGGKAEVATTIKKDEEKPQDYANRLLANKL